MKSNRSYRIVALLMALLMLVSSTGFSIDLHYCQGNLKSFSLFGTAKSCHDKADTKHCKRKEMTCKAEKIEQVKDNCHKNCCSNKKIEIDADDTQKITAQKLSKPQIQFISLFIEHFVLALNKTRFPNDSPHQNYIPPLLNKDIPVLIQSFLL